MAAGSNGALAGPNVLWIVLDTTRADALGPYGAAADASPAITDLASNGEALQGVHATACWTLPSHASMFTGALPRGLGLGQAPAITPQSAAPVVRGLRERLVPEVLRNAGYATAAISANPWVSPYSGFDTGFDRFVQLDTSRQGRLDGPGRRQRLKWDLEAVRGRADDGAADAGRTIREWIERPQARSFFWFVNLLECHSPYLPPRPYHAASAIERLRAAEEARRYLSQRSIWRTCIGEFDVPHAALDRMRRLYAGSVRYADAWLASVLDALERKALLDDTLVIVCSDHGENFGEGGMLSHAFSLDERVTRVPFIVAGPGADAFAGMRSLSEVPSRIAQATGAEDRWQGGAIPEGVAVAQWDAPAPASDPRVQGLVAEWGFGQDAAERLAAAHTSAVDGRWKVLRRGNASEELYDLEADPLELRPLDFDDPATESSHEQIARLRAALDHPLTTASAIYDPPADGAIPSASADELQEIEDRMRLLGYM